MARSTPGKAEARPQAPAASASRLDPRKAAILEAVVTEYIGTAQPVGSQHVAQATGVNVSSATVRSEMAALEHEGYLVQPHTSAGRIPTDKGYRFFVDHLAEPGVLGPVPAPEGAAVLRPGAWGDRGDARADLGPALATSPRTPRWSSARATTRPTVRSVQLVGLGPRLALLVVVLADGAVEKRTLDLSDDDLRRAARPSRGTGGRPRPRSAAGRRSAPCR